MARKRKGEKRKKEQGTSPQEDTNRTAPAVETNEPPPQERKSVQSSKRSQKQANLEADGKTRERKKQKGEQSDQLRVEADRPHASGVVGPTPPLPFGNDAADPDTSNESESVQPAYNTDPKYAPFAVRFKDKVDMSAKLARVDSTLTQRATLDALWDNKFRGWAHLAAANQEALTACNVKLGVVGALKAIAQQEAGFAVKTATQVAVDRPHRHSYRTANVRGKEILEELEETEETPVSLDEIGTFSESLLVGLLADQEARKAFLKMNKRRGLGTLRENHVQEFYTKACEALEKLRGRERMHLIDTHASGLGMKKPDLVISTSTEKFLGCVVATLDAKIELLKGDKRNEATSQCDERMSMLETHQRSRDKFVALAGGADSLELWIRRRTEQNGRTTGLLELKWAKDSPALQLLTTVWDSEPEALGYKDPALPTGIRVKEHLLEKIVPMVECSTSQFGGAQAASTVVVAGLLQGERVVAKRSDRLREEATALRALKDVKGVVQLRAIGKDDAGREWLILAPLGTALPGLPETSALQLIRYFLDVVEAIGRLAQLGWMHGDISYANIQVMNGSAGLIDFGTARRTSEVLAQEWGTGTPVFMALEVIKNKPHTVSSDLQSLFYVYLHIVTEGRLLWARYGPEERGAFDSKAATITLGFEEQVEKITDPDSQRVAKALRRVFYKKGKMRTDVQVKEFWDRLAAFLPEEERKTRNDKVSDALKGV